MKLRLNAAFSLMIATAAGLASTHMSAQPAETVKFRLTLQNATADNALSPFISLVHKHQTNLFHVGTVASAGIAQIAETGGTDILQQELAQNPIVLSTQKVAGGPLTPTEKRSIEFNVPKAFVERGARLTVLAMIGKSNDSFIALRSLELKDFKIGKTDLAATNYDAGSEENTGNVEDFGPGGHPVEKAEGHISFDRGLNQRGNAPETIGWGSIAAYATLERLN